MKKFLLLGMALLLGGCGVKAQETPTLDHYYSRLGVVCEVDNEYVHCVDFNGEEWLFKDDTDEPWSEMDYVTMIIYDNGTKEIYDDIIVKCDYNGWLDGEFGYDYDGNKVIIDIEY